MKPPARPSSSRNDQIGVSTLMGSLNSSSNSQVSGLKRKDRDFENDDEETNINVVVRCRGRNEREVRENSGVVLSTNGVKGRTLELSMGPNSLNNKTYHFDKVFSSAADQAIIYDDVVKPILDEVIWQNNSSNVLTFPRCFQDIIAQFLLTDKLALVRLIQCLEIQLKNLIYSLTMRE